MSTSHEIDFYDDERAYVFHVEVDDDGYDAVRFGSSAGPGEADSVRLIALVIAEGDDEEGRDATPTESAALWAEFEDRVEDRARDEADSYHARRER